ncbi:LysR family transcriptional regulator [Gottfriedia acidiceleris]|uniref:LysR family transcriptional regulator n=1 Tax=Gottfriedia acidiceleris TaxID=371036 RepID=UPI002FFDD7C2
MHLQKLEILVEVAKTGSISSAAENLQVSQSGISQAIAKIEEELGLKIFDHSRIGATLTNEGSKIIKISKEILLKYEELREEARKSIVDHKSEVSVSTIPAFINYLLTPLMAFKNKHSNINIEIVENITSRTMENVIKNKIDIGIICLYGEILKEKDELICDIIQEGTMKVYVSKDSPFAVTKTITPEEFFQQKFILYNGDYIKWFIKNFQRTYGNMNILFSSNHCEEIIRTVSSGMAISLAPNFVLKNNSALLEGKVVEVDLLSYEPLDVTLGLLR